MTDPFIRLALFGALVPITLFAWIVIGLLRGRGVNPLRGVTKVLPRSMVECLLLVLSVLGFLKVGGSKGTNGIRGVSAPVPAPLFSSVSVTTNGTWDFSAPPGATVHERWRRRGAADDWFPLFPAGWSFALGDTSVTNLRVFSRGKSRFPDGTEISPLPATVGVVPEMNWGVLGESNSPSLFWHSLSSDGSLLLTWQNVLLHRAATNPVSVQAELRPSGDVTFRYDLSRLASDGPLSDVAPAAGGVSPDVPLSRGVIGISFKSRDEAICDEARAAFEESLGDLDPFSFPEGSTNTVLEHLFYSGTTNGAFAYPQPTEHTAVLRVSVSGTGSGDLLVGGSYVPLVGAPQMRGGPQANPLLFPVPDGGRVPVYLKGDGTLSVSFDSGEFAFGELPNIAANRCAGWINFPNTKATEPCVHDFKTRKRVVSLPVGSGADDLSCTWQGGGDVQVEDIPPRSARITASFDARETRTIVYTLSHPKQLFGQAQCSQTVRFCPRPPGPDPDEPDPPEDPPWFSEGDPPDEDDVVYLEVPDSGEPGGGDGGADEVCPVHDVPYEQCAHLHAADYTNAVQNVTHMSGVLYVRDPPAVGDQICLEVPDEHVNCCGCPDHWTNCVSVAYRSPRISVTGPGGQDFSSTATSCTVNVAGVRPSRAVGDAGLAFARNGEIYERRDYTVFGVGIRRDGIPLSRYNELNSQFGFPMTVCTNDWRAPALDLVTDVRLPSGTVHLEFAGATAPFALWYCRRGESVYRKLLDSETCPAKDIPIAAWRRVVAGVTPGSAASVPVLVTSPSPGTVRLVLRYWNVVDGAFVQDETVQRITSVTPSLFLDHNQDGALDVLDVAESLGRRFYFWTNTDVWRDNDAFSTSFFDWVRDIAGCDNGDDDVVNGRNDLVNVLPVAICVEPFLAAWNGHNVRVVVRSCAADGVIRRCYSNLEWDSMDGGVSEDVDVDDESSWWNVLYEPKLHSAKMRVLGNDGDELAGEVAARATSERGVVFVEANEDCIDPLEIAVKVDGVEMYSYRPSVSFCDVDLMYRWHNIRAAAGGTDDDSTQPVPGDGPTGLPDTCREDVDLFFVHGYNMNVKEARAWGRAFFKRLWWAGYRGRYHVVAWRGDEDQRWFPGEGLITSDYQKNVENAFASAAALSNVVTSATGRRFVVAHSLGNMVVSAAAQDWGMQYERYFMLNAAVPVEAYVTNAVTAQTRESMTPSVWNGYAERLKSVNWRNLFGSDDSRSGLAWSGRFSAVGSTVNYYSSEEEVLKNGSGNDPYPGREYAWYYQETHKGRKPYIPIYGMGRNEGGWGFNPSYNIVSNVYDEAQGLWVEWSERMSPEQAAAVTNDLRVSPFFLPFENPALCATNVMPQMPYALRAQLLADAIPALSFAVGANSVNDWGPEGKNLRNVNMATSFKNTEMLNKFTNTDDDEHREWRHTFFLKVPYSVVKEFYKNLSNRVK